MQRTTSAVQIWDDEANYARASTLPANDRSAVDICDNRLSRQLDHNNYYSNSSDHFDNIMLSGKELAKASSHGRRRLSGPMTSSKGVIRSNAGVNMAGISSAHRIRYTTQLRRSQTCSRSEIRQARHKKRPYSDASGSEFITSSSKKLARENSPLPKPMTLTELAAREASQYNEEEETRSRLGDWLRRIKKILKDKGDGNSDDYEMVKAPVNDKTDVLMGLVNQDDFGDIPFGVSGKELTWWSDCQVRRKGKDCYFKDGKRLIDLVLPYQQQICSKLPADVAKESMHCVYRQRFQKTLQALGLELEVENLSHATDGKTCFVKIHATWNFLTRTAEDQHIQMPFFTENQLKHRLNALGHYVASEGKKGIPGDEVIEMDNVLHLSDDSTTDKMLMSLNKGVHPFRIENIAMPDFKFKYTSQFNRNRIEMFDDATEDGREHFFTDSQRSRLVYEVILRTRISELSGSDRKRAEDQETKEHLSFLQLLEDAVYKNPMVLHHGECTVENGNDTFPDLMPPHQPYRRWLYDFWGSFWYSWRKFQPLDEIWRYFGVKTSFYFAFLGFYTKHLYAPAFVGIGCLIYGIYSTVIDPITEQYCNIDGHWTNRTTCRLCPSVTCPYDYIGNSCAYAKLSRVFDNEATVVYAVFVALWAVIFLEKWKKRQAFLVEHWQARKGLPDDVDRAQFDKTARQDTLRRTRKWHKAAIEYKEKCFEDPDNYPSQNNRWLKRQQQLIHPVTGGDNIWPSHLRSRAATSLLCFIFFLTVVIGLMTGIAVYRIVSAALYNTLNNRFIDMVGPTLFSSISGSVGNGLVIYVATLAYTRIAWKMTLFEAHRTDKQFETSYTYKIFVFEFFNYFGSILHIALLKGVINDTSPFHQRGVLVDNCPYSGCMAQVCIQLIVIMCCKQIIGNVIEVVSPMIKNYVGPVINRYRSGTKSSRIEDNDNLIRQWEKDFKLNEVTKPYHLSEYLELVIQYGFLIMFAPAFPLAALLALLNNILEIRIDANKLLTEYRRPIPEQGGTIGAWFPIFEIITKLAVVTNALVIAFTSEFIDRLSYAEFGRTHAYLAEIFSTFHTADYQILNATNLALLRFDSLTNKTVETCIYRGFYHDHDSQTPYLKSDLWWKSKLNKLLFVMVFEHLIFLIQSFLQAALPIITEDVATRLKMSQYQEKKSIHFLDSGGGGDAFATLRRRAGEIKSRRNQNARTITSNWMTKAKAHLGSKKSVALKALPNHRQLHRQKKKKANEPLATVYEENEQEVELELNNVNSPSKNRTNATLVQVEKSIRTNNPEHRQSHKRQKSSRWTKTGSKRHLTVSKASMNTQQMRNTEHSVEKKTRLTSDAELDHNESSFGTIATKNVTTMNDVRTTKQQLEIVLNYFDGHPVSEPWSWI